VSAGAIAAGRRRAAPAKKKGKGKRSKRASASPEYNMLLTATLCLLAFGAVMVFSASSTTQVLSHGGLSNSVFFLKRTLIFGALGLVFMHVMARHGLRIVRALTPALLLGSFFLLVVVLGIGSSVNGSTRWIGAGAIQIQPSELAKVCLVLYGAHVFAEHPTWPKTIRGMLPYLLVTGGACALMMLEPDLGTAMVTTFAVSATLVAAGARMRDLLLIAAVAAFLVLLLILVEPYRRDRLIGFLNPGADAAGSGFQALQAKIALGSGGISGVGIGNGVQKAFYLPEAHTDMIAAVIGEEMGFAGIAAIVSLFALFGYAGFRIAQSAKDRYGKLLVAGLTSMILVQAVINLYAVMGLAPLTGVPLPFVSYGNSSLLVSLAAVGLILNVARGGTAAVAAKPARRRSAASGGAKLRLVEGGRSPARGRSGSSGGKSRQGHGRSGGNRGTRRAGHGGRRRASR
jgi:cell division protein FtsW